MAVKGRIYPNIEEGAPREMEPMHVKGGRRDGKAASFELERVSGARVFFAVCLKKNIFATALARRLGSARFE